MKAFENTLKIHIVLILSLVVLSRFLYLLSPVGHNISADESVFGLMAQKIEALEEFPIYMWENPYAGAVVSYIAAFVFHVFGSGPIQLRLTALSFVIVSMTFFYLIYRRLFGETSAFISSIFIIFCPFIVLYYTMGVFGTYSETFLGISILILASQIIEEKRTLFGPSDFAVVLLGFVSGFFFYICFLIIPAILAFVIPTIWHFEHKRLRKIVLFVAGGISGAFPFILYNLTTGGWSFLRAGSWALATGRDQIHLSLPALLKQILINKAIYMKTWFSDAPMMFGLYVLPDLFGELAVSLAGGVLMVVLSFFVFLAFSRRISFSRPQHQWAYFLLFLIIFQWIAGLYKPRHLLPLIIIIPVVLLSLAGPHIKKQYAVYSILLLLSLGQVLNWSHHLGTAVFYPCPVVNSMKGESISTFYGTYNSVYPIMFISKGNLVGSPRLLRAGTHYFDPMPQCTLAVRRSATAAFVFLKDEQDLHAAYRTFLKEQQISYKYILVDGHSIYFHLSKPVDVIVDAKRSSHFILKNDYEPSQEQRI